MKVTAMQAAIVAMVIAAFVVLTLKDKDISVFVSLFSPILSALFVVGHLAGQDRVLDEIHENTNGVLKQKMKDAVQEVLAELGITPPPPGE